MYLIIKILFIIKKEKKSFYFNNFKVLFDNDL